MIKRQEYLDKLIKFKGDGQIKILLGLRRCGKSVILRQFFELEMCAKTAYYIDFEDYQYKNLRNPDNLYVFINELIDSGVKTLLIDEIQFVSDFEDILISFRQKIDLYITGSNSNLLSQEISTKLSGRYTMIDIYPLTYNECVSLAKKKNINYNIYDYLKNGAMPYHSFVDNEIMLDNIRSLTDTIIYNDVLSYYKNIDIHILKLVFEFIVENIGQEFSFKKIVDTLKSNHHKIQHRNVTEIFEALTSANIIHPVEKYDLHGRKKMVQSKKYYLSDVIFRNLLFRELLDIGNVIENVVYISLLKSGYNIKTGRVGTYEIDFIATKDNLTYNIQVSYSIIDPQTRDRELRPFEQVNGFANYLITMDDFKSNIPDFVRQISLIDFLTNGLS